MKFSETTKWFLIPYISLGLTVLFIAVRAIDLNVTKEDNIGTIGDAFNGLTAPILALVNIGLIFYTFREQVRANQKQMKSIEIQISSNKMTREQWQFDKFLKLHTNIKESFEKIKITFNKDAAMAAVVDEIEKTEHFGKDALEKIAFQPLDHITGKRLALKQFEHVLQELIFLVDNITKEKYYDSLMRRIITTNYDANFAKLIEKLTKKIKETNGYEVEYNDLLATMGGVEVYIEAYKKTLLLE